LVFPKSEYDTIFDVFHAALGRTEEVLSVSPEIGGHFLGVIIEGLSGDYRAERVVGHR